MWYSKIALHAKFNIEHNWNSSYYHVKRKIILNLTSNYFWTWFTFKGHMTDCGQCHIVKVPNSITCST